MRTSFLMLIGMLLLIAHATSYASDSTDIDICNKYSATKTKLNLIYDEYSSLPKISENAEKLFLLYRRLEQAVTEARALYPPDYNHNIEQYLVISDCLWNSKFMEIGLSIGHYSDRLELSEQLVNEVHWLNPNSRYRSYTLHTEIFGEKDLTYDLPSVEKAMLYLKEFPSGPNVRYVYKILAGFYHDLYAALREREVEPRLEERGVTYSCYDEYIDNHPEAKDKERARKLGIYYFEKLIAITTIKDVSRPMYLDELDSLKKKKTDNVVNVCGD